MRFPDTSSFSIPEFGQCELATLTDNHYQLIWQWTQHAYAHFWGMTGHQPEQVASFYAAIQANPHCDARMVLRNGEPVALVEFYAPQHDPVGEHYDVEPHDVGMHILLQPCTRPEKHFSFNVMRYVMEALFAVDPDARVVVEPDIRNQKIHQLNKRIGFRHEKRICLSEKIAYLGFCRQQQFRQAVVVHQRRMRVEPANMMAQPAHAITHLKPGHSEAANRALIAKMLSEFSHERLITLETEDCAHFTLPFAQGEYRFSARAMMLNHISVDATSIKKWKDNAPAPLCALTFITEFARQLGLEGDQLATYLEETASSLASACFKRARRNIPASSLVHEDFQTIESHMTEGHPVFIANNGRIGFGAEDYQRYAPEAGVPIQLIWLAAAPTVCDFTSDAYASQSALLVNELDLTLRERFASILDAVAVDTSEYVLVPVHPWQWEHKIYPVFSQEIANHRLIYLGIGDDYYVPQQSIRTFYNLSHPDKHYVKVALSILNMGFMRGLSASYMASTPGINEWIADLVRNDTTLKSYGFEVLREHATVGYHHTTFSAEAVGDTPYRKMLAALWRESPSQFISDGEQLMTMAALLHRDYNGSSFVTAMITTSGLSATAWINQYLRVYLAPLLHCFYQYKLVFMPHGENLILKCKDAVPVGAFMKDIGEEVCLLNYEGPLPAHIERIRTPVPKEVELLSIFTDVFDCYFRFLVDILVSDKVMSEQTFWRCVADTILDYQQAHPELSTMFSEYDLFGEKFAHSCLNRLQLGNNKQMVDLTDPAGSLKFAGTLDNPIAQFAVTPVEQAV